MLRLIIVFILFSTSLFSQSDLLKPEWFKGDHFVAYNKCKKAVIFCENTQQDYTFCGAFINCQGLYVNPGDTFFINYENKWQNKKIVSDVHFQGYLPSVYGYTFAPVVNCVPPQAFLVAIPLTAVPGSSFEITVQNSAYDPPETNVPNIPYPFLIYVGGQPAPNSVPLANYTDCDITDQEDTTSVDVSVTETGMAESVLLYPNPANTIATIKSDRKIEKIEISTITGQVLSSEPTNQKEHQLKLNDFEEGIYFIKIVFPDDISSTKKIIINH